MAILTFLWGLQQKYGKKWHYNFTAESRGSQAHASYVWSRFLGVVCPAEEGPK